MAVRCVSEPREPKAPPMYGETTWMSSGRTPICFARPCLKPETCWLPSQTVSLPSFQAQVVVKSSIGLWCCVGVL